MNLSLGVAAGLLVVKVAAAVLTGSSAIYSDAAESITHLLAVGFAAWALRLSHKPPDETHHFGHDKVSFFSSGFEGAMICAAGLLVGFDAVRNAISGNPIERMGLGMILTGAAALVNLFLGLALVRVGKKRHSTVLRANGEHVLADVWTSLAVLLALVLIQFTGWRGWDPLCAGIAAVKLLWSGGRLMRGSFGGLMDEADPEIERRLHVRLGELTAARDLSYHNFRHRHSGRTHWVEFHLVFPDEMNIRDAHAIGTDIEAEISSMLEPDCRVITHFEPRSEEHREEDWEMR